MLPFSPNSIGGNYQIGLKPYYCIQEGILHFYKYDFMPFYGLKKLYNFKNKIINEYKDQYINKIA